MVVNSELGRMWKEAAVIGFKAVSSRNFYRGTEETLVGITGLQAEI
jgi:hypothetical protein